MKYNTKEIMQRAWQIYRTLKGDRDAKLSYALRQAWAEAKNDGGEGYVPHMVCLEEYQWAKAQIEKLLNE